MAEERGNKQRVVVGLSGGVDSAVSAWLLKQQGFEVVGIFMKNWEDDDRGADDGADTGADTSADTSADNTADNTNYCSSNIDFVDAAAVADVIGIELEHVNFAAEYKDRVFAEFLREHQAGRTPNPDVLCNAEIKFKAFLDHALRLGADKIATGHYARVRFDATSGRHQLLKGLDPAKDQSYFLHRLTQAQLARTLFPLGELVKTEVRRIAAQIGLPNAAKKDSTGICFIGERPFRDFLQRYLKNQPGPMRDERSRIVGRHVGLSFYTLGQRQGLGIGGTAGGADAGGVHAPWYVAHKELATNTLRVVQGHDHPWLQALSLHAADCSWIAGEAPPAGPLAAKTRYRQTDASCTLVHRSDACANFRADGRADGRTEPVAEPVASFRLDFEQAQWAVTPGQSAVLYDGEVCLGGGVIDRAEVPALNQALAAEAAESAGRLRSANAPAPAPTRAGRRPPARKPALLR